MSTEAFDDLLATHLEGIRRFVRRRMRTQDYADDVVQRTLLLAFAHRNQLQSPAKFRSWLYSIAVNEIRLIRRSTKRCVSLSVNPELEPAGTETSPLIRFQEWERQTHLMLAMARLHEGDQATLQLELDGLSIPETAAAMVKSVSAAKSARFLARQRLAVALRKQSFVLGAAGNSRS